MKKDESLIPFGLYCYDQFGKCSYLSKVSNKPEQENGYCSFLEKGDWDFKHIGLLWDACKECGVNTLPDLDNVEQWDIGEDYEELLLELIKTPTAETRNKMNELRKNMSKDQCLYYEKMEIYLFKKLNSNSIA